MRARTNNILTIEDAIKSHPMLSKRQKDELITGFNKFTDEACKAVFAEYTERFDKELSAMSLLVLHNEFGFGEERLGRFAKLFGNLMDELHSKLKGTGIAVGSGCYHDLKSLYPQCDDWILSDKK